MTRNALFLSMSPPRRLSGMAALFAAATLSGSLVVGTASPASAQSTDDSTEIRQVAGSRGLLSGLFGGSSKKSKEPYRHATPVPSDREVNWSGIPYHNPSGGRTASSQPAPIRDPGPSSRQVAQPNRTTAPAAEVTQPSRSSVPSPPPIAQSMPRKLSSTADLPVPENSLTSSTRPEPLSVSRSSRRPISTQPPAPQPTRLETSRPALVENAVPVITRRDETNVELVPKVSRKVIASNSPTTPSEIAKTPAPKTQLAKTEPAKAEPTRTETAKTETAKTEVATMEVAQKQTVAPRTEPTGSATNQDADAQQSVAATDASSSRRRAVTPDPVPRKIESASSDMAKTEVSKPQATPPAAETAPAAKSAPATETAPVIARRELQTPPQVQASAPQVAASKPASSAPADETVLNVPTEAATTMMSKFTRGDARQSAGTTNEAAATLGTPAIASSRNVTATSAPVGNVSAPGETAVQSDVVAENHVNRMNTFGNNQPGGRPGGSLAAATSTGVALQPISDRLPIDGQNESEEQIDVKQESMFAFGQDTFSARTSGGENVSPTVPNYHSVGYGVGANRPAQPNFMPTAPAPTKNTHPNSMREPFNATSAAPANSSMPAPAVNVTPEAKHSNTATSSTDLPVIRIMTAGPRQVMIRQTHPYEIRVENRGATDAEGLVIRAHIPDWADVVGQQVSRGDVNGATENQIRSLNWKIDRLDAGQSETMFVRLKASRPGTHDLDVDWALTPQKRVVQVTVQEPQLALTIDGPDEVIYGQSKTYQIRVLNPGDGIAPAVVFTLSPQSSSPQSQRIGDIPAGKEAQFEVELTAQDLGELKIHGLAIGDLDLKTEAEKTVRVLAADLEAVLSGPEAKYQDTQAVYQLELTNHGTTASEDVVAQLELPMGVTYQGGMEGATMIDNNLHWKIASLTPGAVRKYQFQCRMDTTGTHQYAFRCKGSAAGQTNVEIETKVEAIADLALSIVDPTAPAPIGEDVSYQIVIRNRGSKPALDVQAIAQFSHGIEPKQISGHMGKVITGQVLIDPIPRIDAGQEVRMTIVAQAETGGHHRFRTEVRSGDTVLVAEEATHYLAPQNERITRRSGPGGNEFSLPLRK